MLLNTDFALALSKYGITIGESDTMDGCEICFAVSDSMKYQQTFWFQPLASFRGAVPDFATSQRGGQHFETGGQRCQLSHNEIQVDF